MTKVLLIMVAFLSAAGLFAQETGSFEKIVDFMGEQRTLAYYVPEDYNAENQYELMVSLHGLGDSATNLRNVLIGANWQSQIPNTIFVFVDGGYDAISDHLAPEGDEDLVYVAIDSTLKNYNISSDDIILHGFSLGGRSALKIGLDNPDYFKALYLSTPAVQGILDLNNDPLGSGTFYNYENASRIPIAITVGNQDISYFNQNVGLFLKLAENNGIANIFPFSGGHTIVVGPNTEQVFDFLDNPASESAELQIFRRDGLDQICSASQLGVAQIRNKGAEDITSYKIGFSLDGSTYPYSITQQTDLASFEFEELELGSLDIEFNEGDNTLYMKVLEINDVAVTVDYQGSESDDSFVYNGVAQSEIHVSPMDFTGDDEWIREENFLPFDWFEEENDGTQMLLAFNHPYYFDNTGYAHTLSSPLININSLQTSEKTIEIDYAFNYMFYQFQDGTTAEFSDTLELLYTTDCGITWSTLYRAAGSELATFDAPVTNSTDLNSLLLYPSAADYETLSLDISSIDAEAVRFRLNYISGVGGVLWLDEIRIGQEPGYVAELEGLELFPNPALDNISLSYDKGQLSDLRIVDATGAIVAIADKGKFGIDVSNLGAGAYTVIGLAGGDSFAKPFIKR